MGRAASVNSPCTDSHLSTAAARLSQGLSVAPPPATVLHGCHMPRSVLQLLRTVLNKEGARRVPVVVPPTGIENWPAPWDFGQADRLIRTAAGAADLFLDRLDIGHGPGMHRAQGTELAARRNRPRPGQGGARLRARGPAPSPMPG